MNIDPFPKIPERNNSYCTACKEYIKGQKPKFPNHLRKVHNMIHFSSESSERAPDNVEYYCPYCDEEYDIPEKFRYHVILVHKAIKTPFTKKTVNEPTTFIDPYLRPRFNDPYYYCRSCELTCTDRKVYRQHLRITHHINGCSSYPPRMLPRRILRMLKDKPEMDNPGFYCTICKRKYAKPQFRSHLRFFRDVIHPEDGRYTHGGSFCHGENEEYGDYDD